MKKIFGSLNARNTIGQAAVTMGVFYLGSAILGFIRDRLLASTFGAENGLLDSYYAAFRIPDFVLNVLVLGAVSAAFIPIFIDYYAKDKKDEAWKIANTLLNSATILLIAVALIIAIFAKPLLEIVTHGFKGDFATLLSGERIPLIDLTATLTRIMLISSICFGISSIAGAVQNSLKRFTLYAVAPVVYNLGIIFGIIFLSPKFDIYGAAYGVVIGAVLQMILSLASIYQLGFRNMFVMKLRHPGFIKIVRLMLFRAGALMVDQINLLVEISVGSTLAAGSIAFFTLANNLERLPATLFGISLATAVFPALAESMSHDRVHRFVEQFSHSVRQILFLVIPISVGFILLRKEITSVILSAGQFTPLNARITASALGYFSLSLFAQATMPIITRAFFSLKDTKTPFFVALLTMIVNFFAAVFASRTLGLGAPGLAIAFSLTSILNVTLLTYLLRRRLGEIDAKRIIKSLTKIGVATLGMIGAVVLLRTFFGTDLSMSKVSILFHIAVFGLVGGGVYFAVAWILKSPEIAFIKNLLVRFKLVKA